MTSQNPFKNPKPFDLGEIIGTPDLKNISYTSFDFYSIKARVIEYVKKYFPNDFNNFIESDLGIMLIELWAYMADLISFKMDMYVNELYIDTVSQRKNAHRLAKLVGYPVRLPRASTCRIALTISASYSFDIKINRGLSVSIPSRDNRPMLFEIYSADEEWNPIFDEDIIIPAGSTSNLSVIAIEGVSSSNSFTSDATQFQSFTIPEDSILDGSVNVYVNNQLWKNVEYFIENDNGPYYRIEYDENYRPTIIFSDDIRGKIPPQGAEIKISYRYGGGDRGNIDLGFINQIMNVSSDIVPGPVPINVTNYTKGEGGESAETVDQIKYNLPLWLKAQNRAVSGEDYSFLSESFSTLYHGRIAKAKASLRNSGCSGNIVDIYVLQLDGKSSLKTANPTLKRELKNFLLERKMLTDYICIKDASQVFQNININISINRFYNEFKKDIADKISEYVNDFFKLERWEIGQALKKQDLIQWLNKVPSVSSIDIEFVSNSQNLVSSTEYIMVDFWKIIRPGNININVEAIN